MGVLVLSDSQVAEVLEVGELLGVVEDAFVKQGRDEVERPERPHFPVGKGLESEYSSTGEAKGTALTMPAYIHGAGFYATKLVSVHESNPERSLPTVNAQIALNEAETGLPVSYMQGTRITNARTGCIGGLAVRELAHEPVTLGVLGAGTQARWQTRAICAATDVSEVRVYSPSDSKYECASDLENELNVDSKAVESPEEAVKDANAVVTATTSTEPVFPAESLEKGALVVAVGAYTSEMQELEPGVFEKASKVFADVPEEVAEIGDILASELDESDLIPLSEIFEGREGRENADETIVLESVRTAVLDAATSEYVYGKAEDTGVGTSIQF